LGVKKKELIHNYCHYPDLYDPAGDVKRAAALRVYCVKPDGKSIHNVTWQRQEDTESLEYLLKGMVSSLGADRLREAAQYAGVLAHFLEDSTCPGHAFIPFDDRLDFVKDLLPPPPGKEHIVLHVALEATLPEFDLRPRAPQTAGPSIPDAASNLLDRCYAIIRDNRAHLIEMVRALYEDDDVTLNSFCLRAGKAGAELLADAYYTAFVFSGQTPALSRRDPFSKTLEPHLSDTLAVVRGSRSHAALWITSMPSSFQGPTTPTNQR
jgi:hypothetical protein